MVIGAPDPDDADESYFISDPVPRLGREQIRSHTPKMLHVERDGKPWSTTHQRGQFVCPDDAAWERITALRDAVLEAMTQWKQLLRELGTYRDALADGRYADRPVTPAAPAVPAYPPTWPALEAPLIYGHHRNASAGGVAHAWRPEPRLRSKGRHKTLCNTVMTEPPRPLDRGASPRLCADCRREALKLAPAPSEETTMPTPAPSPPAVADFWQALSHAHPTAHHWHHEGGDTYRSACGIRSRHHPVGTHDVGHCSRCTAAIGQPTTLTPALSEQAAPAEPAAQWGPRELLIHHIRRDGGTQARVGLNEDVVQEYAEAMRDGRWDWASIRRPLVYSDGGSDYWLADGFHRIEAAQRVGRGTYQVEVLKGDKRAAQLHAARANADHGLRRSRQDVQRAIELLLRDEEWARWSDREIARHVHCAHATVGTARRHLEATGQIVQSTDRQGADGRVTKTAGIAAANQTRAVDKAPTLSTDDEHIAAARQILATLDQWADSARPGRFQEAYGHARAVGDVSKREALFAAIDRAMEGTAPIAEPARRGKRSSPRDTTPETITISTDVGPHAITPTRRLKDLALHPWIGQPQAGAAWAITYVPIGGRVGPGFATQELGEAALEDLAALDWSGVQGTIIPPDLTAQARAILARYSGPASADDERMAPMRARWLALGFTQFSISDHGYTAVHPQRGTYTLSTWAHVEAAIVEYEQACARCGNALKAGSMKTPVGQLCPNCSHTYLQETASAQKPQSAALPAPAQPVAARLPSRPQRPARDDVSVLLAYVRELEAYADALEQLALAETEVAA